VRPDLLVETRGQAIDEVDPAFDAALVKRRWVVPLWTISPRMSCTNSSTLAKTLVLPILGHQMLCRSQISELESEARRKTAQPERRLGMITGTTPLPEHGEFAFTGDGLCERVV
jgi:hypothetical protein